VQPPHDADRQDDADGDPRTRERSGHHSLTDADHYAHGDADEHANSDADPQADGHTDTQADRDSGAA
jgi:hypothetical protein